MAVYSIKDVEKLTGIRAHTLRAWEQRYNLIMPRRTETNIRYYLDEDLRLLFNIALLNKNGLRISKIAAMSPTERTEAVAGLPSLNVSADTQLDALTLSAVEMDDLKFNHIVDMNVRQRGFEETMMEVIYPFLDKLGVLYFTGSVGPIQEAFIGALIRQKILAATDELPNERKNDALVFALYLPEGERQELSMLFIQYLLRKRGFHTLYLGTDISPIDLGQVARVTHVDYLFTILSNTFVERPVEQLIECTLTNCPEATLLLSGYQVNLHDLSGYERVRKISGLGAMLGFLETVSSPVVQ